MFIHEAVDLGYKDLDAETSKTGRLYNVPGGAKYPSITTVLSILNKDEILKWRKRVGEKEANRISTQASRRGTQVHDLIERYVKNDPDYKFDSNGKPVPPYVIENFNSVKNVIDQSLEKVYAQEVPLYSDYLGVAGRVDCIGIWDGKLSVIDWKTSGKEKKKDWIKNYFMQESFYAIAWEERTGIPITQLVTLIAVDNAEPQIFIEHRDNWSKDLQKTIAQYKEQKFFGR